MPWSTFNGMARRLNMNFGANVEHQPGNEFWLSLSLSLRPSADFSLSILEINIYKFNVFALRLLLLMLPSMFHFPMKLMKNATMWKSRTLLITWQAKKKRNKKKLLLIGQVTSVALWWNSVLLPHSRAVCWYVGRV